MNKMSYKLNVNHILSDTVHELLVPMQFTGLKDCNDKEIYESDVIKDKYGYVNIVFFKNGSFVYKSITEKLDLYYNLNNINKECEIIGNIYENPKLLKSWKSKQITMNL